MRVLFINSVCGIRSTGRICADLSRELEAQGHECKIAYGRMEEVPEQYKKYAVRIGTNADMKFHGLRTRLLDEHGFGSKRATRDFLKWADDFDPDMLWLHNLHGYYINVELLFDWIKSRPGMKVNWTLHDCWAFTGHCSHFTYVKCDKWKTHCENCPQKGRYPASVLRDNSENNYLNKKRLFTHVKGMTLITPSQWLAGLVKQSFLRDYPVEVRYNKIDTSVFKPTPGNFRERYGLEGKKIILGVASTWDERKGLLDFFKLADMLNENYRIVLAGLNAKQMKMLKPNMVGIGRTNSAQELAEIYSAADVFFNPTYEDTYPTVNLEAEACGTRVITYDAGGAPETVQMTNSKIIPVGSVEQLTQQI